MYLSVSLLKLNIYLSVLPSSRQSSSVTHKLTALCVKRITFHLRVQNPAPRPATLRFSAFSSVPPGQRRDSTSNQTTTESFHTFSMVLVTNYYCTPRSVVRHHYINHNWVTTIHVRYTVEVGSNTRKGTEYAATVRTSVVLMVSIVLWWTVRKGLVR